MTRYRSLPLRPFPAATRFNTIADNAIPNITLIAAGMAHFADLELFIPD
jgi:hypothetical protein